MVTTRQVTGGQQLGKVLLTITGGRELDASLYDISPHGVGFNMNIRDLKKISVGMAINLRCPWNQNLLGYTSRRSVLVG